MPDDDRPPAGYGDHPRRSPWWRGALAAIAVIALALGIGWVVAVSPVLGVRQISVRGESLLTEAQIRAAAGIVDGTPLVRLDRGAVRARLAALPEVESVLVSVSYPS
ncbi:MAG: peptidase, partial [Pseudonocardiales bacterium]|nr:peptidase [Pseudonocardiales bacterium]